MDIAKYSPTAIVKITVDELTVPIDTGIEMSKLAVSEKEVLLDLLKEAYEHEDEEKRAILKQALEWYRELRHMLKDIHDLTKGVQERAMLKGYEIQGQIAKEMAKKMSNEDLVKFIKTLEKENESVTVNAEFT